MFNNATKSGESILKDSIFIIGTVSSVEGRKVKVKVKKDKNLSHLSYKGKIIKNVSVGSYIKIAKGFIEIIGKVEGEYITKERELNEEYKKEELKIARFLDVSLFGHFEKGKFKQGIKEMPLIDNECYLLDKDEFNKLHQFYNNGEKTIEIGTLTEEPSQEIKIGIGKLFASHIGIFGNTGSGKSNTLAKIYTELFHIIHYYQEALKNSGEYCLRSPERHRNFELHFVIRIMLAENRAKYDELIKNLIDGKNLKSILKLLEISLNWAMSGGMYYNLVNDKIKYPNLSIELFEKLLTDPSDKSLDKHEMDLMNLFLHLKAENYPTHRTFRLGDLKELPI